MSAFDDEQKRMGGVATEDWCRGHYVRHWLPRDAPLAVRTYGVVTIIYLEDPVVECVEPVCEECYQVWCDCGGDEPYLLGARKWAPRSSIAWQGEDLVARSIDTLPKE